MLKNTKLTHLLRLLLLMVFCIGCSKGSNGVEIPPTKSEPIERSRIAWDYSSLEDLGEATRYAGYPRMIRLKNDALFFVYEKDGEVALRKSLDNGESWSNSEVIFNSYTVENEGELVLVRAFNSEIIELQNGNLIMGCNYRPQKNGVEPFTIAVRRSVDGGESWQEIQKLYGKEKDFHNGCWEPSFLQLPDGTVQIYFANENPYTNSDEQEISLLESYDNGASWTKEHKTVSFRKGFRDGMPVSVLLGDEIVTAIEDNGDGVFKSYTVRTKIADNWSEPVLAESPQRDYSLKEKVEQHLYMGAPYLLVLPSGETLMAYQTTRGRTAEWEHSTMEVAIGNKRAMEFEVVDYPFAVPLDREAKWNSIMLWNEQTVAALASSNWDGGIVSAWMKKGRIIPKTVALNSEQYPIFIGSKGEAQLEARLRSEADVVKVEAVVDDGEESGDKRGVYLYLNLDTNKDNALYRVFVGANGEKKISKLSGKKWVASSELAVDVSVEQRKGGYSVLFAFDKGEIKSSQFNFSLALSAQTNNGTNYVEHLVKSNEYNPNTWLRANKE